MSVDARNSAAPSGGVQGDCANLFTMPEALPSRCSNRAETIVALASGPGHARRAIVRLSGPATIEALRSLMLPPLGNHAPAAAGAMFARLHLGDSHSIPAQLLLYRAPRSFTGEDAAEILLCGNPWLTERLVRAFCELRVPGAGGDGDGGGRDSARRAGRVCRPRLSGRQTLALASRGHRGDHRGWRCR